MAKNPPPFDPKNLPSDPKVLQELLLELMTQLQDKDRKLEAQAVWIAELRTRLFGKKTESLSEENQRLLDFIVEGVVARQAQPRPEPPPTPEKKGHGRTKLPSNLPRDIVLHDVPAKERRCGCCGKKLVEIGRVTSEQADYAPAAVHVKKHVRIKYGCPDTDCRGTIMLADVPPMAVPKSKAAPGMLAYVAMSKYGHHLPLFRLEEILALHGLPVCRTTLWEWIWGAADALVPIYEAMKKEVQGSWVIGSDETPVALWDREHKILKQGRQWVYHNPEHTVFEFSPDRKKKHPEAFLAGSKGVVLSDAYAGYRSVAEANGALVNAFCWAHVRRQYWKAQDTDRARAIVAMAYIKALYSVETEGKELSPSKLQRLRVARSKPILEEFRKWIGEQGQMVLPKSPIGKAMAYTTNNWKELIQFLQDGRIRLDNNISEQQLRPIAVGRKNWLRYQSERGGKAAAILSSLIASCRRNKKNPFEYLRDVLERIPTHAANKILDLTPARWKPQPNTS